MLGGAGFVVYMPFDWHSTVIDLPSYQNARPPFALTCSLRSLFGRCTLVSELDDRSIFWPDLRTTSSLAALRTRKLCRLAR